MKIGVCEWVLPLHGPVLFGKLARLGIGGIQLDDGGPHKQGFPLRDRSVQSLYREYSKKYGIALISMGGNELGRSGGFIHAPESLQGLECREIFQNGILACREMEIPIYLVPTFFEGFIKTRRHYSNLAENLKWACDYARSHGVRLGLESLLSPEEWEELWLSVGSDWLEIYYDIQNPATYRGIRVADELRRTDFGKICQIHVKDGKQCVQGSCQLGDGETGAKESLAVIREKGYQGWLVLENGYGRPYFESGHTRWEEQMKQDIGMIKALDVWRENRA